MIRNSGCHHLHCVRHRRFRAGFTFLELLVVIFLIVVIAGIVIFSIVNTRGALRNRETANRVQCAMNLRQIGQAILLYANENHGNYPRTFYTPGAPLVFSNDTSDGGRKRDPFGLNGLPGRVNDNDMTAAIFLLMRTQDITNEVFVCPSSDATRDTFGTAPGVSAMNKTSFTDWRKNLSYSFVNWYPDAQAINNGYRKREAPNAQFAICADMNPGVGDGFDVTAATETSPPAIMQRANSRNHQGAGQNVLYEDGHVEFQNNPFCGDKRDNIYTVSGSDDGSITTSKTVAGSPRGRGDSVLLPARK